MLNLYTSKILKVEDLKKTFEKGILWNPVYFTRT
jgi:hypothetical protein